MAKNLKNLFSTGLQGYKKAFGKVVPFILPVIVTFAIKGQFKMADQQKQINDLEIRNEKMAMQMQGLTMTAAATGEEIYEWLHQATTQGMLDQAEIPAFEEPDYFVDSYNRMDATGKNEFIQVVNQKITNPASKNTLVISYALG